MWNIIHLMAFPCTVSYSWGLKNISQELEEQGEDVHEIAVIWIRFQVDYMYGTENMEHAKHSDLQITVPWCNTKYKNRILEKKNTIKIAVQRANFVLMHHHAIDRLPLFESEHFSVPRVRNVPANCSSTKNEATHLSLYIYAGNYIVWICLPVSVSLLPFIRRLVIAAKFIWNELLTQGCIVVCARMQRE